MIGLVVVFRKERDSFFVITAYPSSKYESEIKRKLKTGRWVETRGRRA